MDAQKLSNIFKPELNLLSAMKQPLADIKPHQITLIADQVKASSVMTGASIAATASRDFNAKVAPLMQAHERTGMARLQKMVADSVAPQSSIKGLSSSAIDSMLKSIEHEFVRPSHLTADLGSFISASEIIRSNLGLPSGLRAFPARPITPPSRTPVHRREEVRRFLRRRHPAALRKLDGIYDVSDSADGTGQSAYSATELFKLVVFDLVSHAEVKQYARDTYRTGTQKRHALELIAIKYSLDVTILMALSNRGNLADDFQHVKHFEVDMDQVASRAMLLDLIDQFESLLVFLAQSIDR